MQNPTEDVHHAMADQIGMSSAQFEANLHKMHDIAAQIGAFHMARMDIYKKTFGKMAGIKDMQELLTLQQDFIQSSMDNLLSHSKTITELLARPSSGEFETGEDFGEQETRRRK